MEETRKFMDHSFREGVLEMNGIDIDIIMPAVPRLGDGSKEEKNKRVINRLVTYFEKYQELMCKGRE